MSNIYLYIFVAFATTYVIRILPLTVIRKPIENRFVKSFLYYVPYVTLVFMTFPAIIDATQSPISGLAAFVVAVIASWFGGNLFVVASLTCVTVFIVELFL